METGSAIQNCLMEREVKTKHTPMLFGSTFKGSKWVDYQTFNINKLFIKSGLSYFYYLLTLFTLLFFFLGRSKAEQYFGFIPLFAYFNFILGYVPLVFSDILSQTILIIYILYITITNLIYKFLNKLTINTLSSIENTLTSMPKRQNNQPSPSPVSLKNLFNTQPKPQLIPFFSKTLSKLHGDLSLINSNFKYEGSNKQFFINNLFMSTLQIKKSKLSLAHTLSLDESLYSNIPTLNNLKLRSSQIHLNDIHRFNKLTKSPIFFNFNIENNLNTSKQLRWLTKNSLLSEAIMPNSFLITQAKKLIGLGFLDKDFSDKTLWLPTKSSKLSSIESLNYFNNLSNQIFKKKIDKSFLKLNKLQQAEFTNLNFFENSRL